jgi:DNA-binding transcriptional MocR family regulator
MPDENKKAVVQLMEKHNIPLIEDDLYADLYFGKHHPHLAKHMMKVALCCGVDHF